MESNPWVTPSYAEPGSCSTGLDSTTLVEVARVRAEGMTAHAQIQRLPAASRDERAAGAPVRLPRNKVSVGETQVFLAGVRNSGAVAGEPSEPEPAENTRCCLLLGLPAPDPRHCSQSPSPGCTTVIDSLQTPPAPGLLDSWKPLSLLPSPARCLGGQGRSGLAIPWAGGIRHVFEVSQ